MKKLNHILSLSLAAAALLFAGCSKTKNTTSGSAPVSTDTGGAVEMKVKWEVGKEYDQRFWLKQTNESKIPNMPKPMVQQTTMDEDFSISVMKQLPDGGKELELKVTGFKMEAKQGERSLLNFDSSSDAPTDPKNAALAGLRAVVGMSFKYNVDDAGDVNNITGLDEAVARFDKADPATKSALQSMFNEDMVKQMARRNFGLPEKPVKVGDHWPVHLDMKSGPIGTLNMNMNVTFKGLQNHEGKKCDLMEYTGDISIQPGSKGSMNGMDISMDTSALSGSMWFDPELGMVVDSLSDQDFDLKIVAQGQTIHSKLKQLVGVKLVLVTDIPK